MQSKITRRKMLQNSASLTLGSAFLLNSSFSMHGKEQDKLTRVVLIRNANLLDQSGNLNQQILSEMLDEALIELTQTDSRADAWKKIIRPGDVVGIKTDHWNQLPTPPELESILKSRVREAGIKESDLSVNDRGVLSDPVFKRSTALINVKPMRAHAWAGVGSLIKNYIMFLETPSSIHNDSCADLASIWNFPEVKGKTRLNILVMIAPLFHLVGSNRSSREYTWNYNGLVLGFDPVAVDSVGLQIILAKRKEHFQDNRPLNPPAKHIELADTRHHLGTADLSKIDLVKMGWSDSSLI